MQLSRPVHNQSYSRRVILLVLAATMTLPGCSLAIMTGKLFFDDPKMKSTFRAGTGTDLTKVDKSILIACSAPHHILTQHPGIRIDIVDKMSRMLATHKVNVVPPDDVAAWFDDHGDWGDFSELADHFDADFVMHIDLKSFSVIVPDSPHLLQGKSEGKITVMEVTGSGKKKASIAFERTVSVMFPEIYPIPRESRSEETFTENFIDRISRQLAMMLYDHRPSEEVN